MQVTQELVGRHLDGWIAQYFSCSDDRNKYTLGEFLAEWLPQVGNTYALQWIANGGKNSAKPASPELRETDPDRGWYGPNAQGGANHTTTTNDFAGRPDDVFTALRGT